MEKIEHWLVLVHDRPSLVLSSSCLFVYYELIDEKYSDALYLNVLAGPRIVFI